jgi:hypothetical protein
LHPALPWAAWPAHTLMWRGMSRGAGRQVHWHCMVHTHGAPWCAGPAPAAAAAAAAAAGGSVHIPFGATAGVNATTPRVLSMWLPMSWLALRPHLNGVRLPSVSCKCGSSTVGRTCRAAAAAKSPSQQRACCSGASGCCRGLHGTTELL